MSECARAGICSGTCKWHRHEVWGLFIGHRVDPLERGCHQLCRVFCGLCLRAAVAAGLVTRRQNGRASKPRAQMRACVRACLPHTGEATSASSASCQRTTAASAFRLSMEPAIDRPTGPSCAVQGRVSTPPRTLCNTAPACGGGATDRARDAPRRRGRGRV